MKLRKEMLFLDGPREEWREWWVKAAGLGVLLYYSDSQVTLVPVPSQEENLAG